MNQTNRLINELKDERKYSEHDVNKIASLKSRLVDDVEKAWGFVSYLGSFNIEFRQILLDEYFHKNHIER